MNRSLAESLESRRLFSTVRFAVIGDFGDAGPNELAVAELVKRLDPEFILTVGDNNYPTGSADTIDPNIGQYYQDYIHPYVGSYGTGSPTLTNRFFPALGNHDWDNGNLDPWYDFFTLPGNERYYDFVQGPVHFFVIDSDTREPDGTSPTSAQGQWLQTALLNSTSPHNLVFFHHPAYSSASSHGSQEYMRWPFAEWGATAVFAGHDHTYERIAQEGISYFVDGLGGRSINSFGTPIAGSQIRYNTDYGAMLVLASETSIIYRFYNTSGILIDSFPSVATTPQSLIPAGATWSYLDTGTDQGTAWRQLGFDDSAWASGPAELGYGDGDEATIIGYGPNPNQKYVTSYFRRNFSIADPSIVQSLSLTLRRDDGAVVYLNGIEVHRTNMPAGAINYQTLASGAVENATTTIAIPTNRLVLGTNVLAVEVHQSGGSSSDVSFDANLIADVQVPTLASPAGPDLIPASDLGFSNTDDLTSDTTPTFSGSATSGLIVELLCDGITVGSAAASDGTYQVTATTLGDGPHQMSVRLRDGIGQYSITSSPLSIHIDTVVPTINSAQFLFDSDQQVALEFSEPLDPAITAGSFSLVRLMGNDPIVKSLQYNGSMPSATIDFPEILPDGNYRLGVNASARDRAGNPIDPSFGFDFFVLAGDASRDRLVNLQDLILLAVNWQQSGRTFSSGDFNYDSIVNSADLGILALRWQQRLESPPPLAAALTSAARPPRRAPTRLIELVI